MKNLNLISSDYYTQRNNRIRPKAACMPTARVMYYRGNNIKYSNPTALSDDDYLMRTLNTPEAQKFAKKKYPWACKNNNLVFPANEIHGMYNTYLDQIVVGRRTGDFHTSLSVEKIIDVLAAGYVIMTSGTFRGIAGHAFCLIGYSGGNFYLADPWGDWRSNYSDVRGYGTTMTRDEMIAHVKPVGLDAKWAHLSYEAIAGKKRV